MTDVQVKTPWHIWLVGLIALLFNSIGVFDFVMSSLVVEKKVEVHGEAVSLFGAGLGSSNVETERLAAARKRRFQPFSEEANP